MVMAFYNDINLEPKRKNRWLLYINGVEPWLIASFTKPSYNIGNSEYQEINIISYKPNVLKWNPCKFSMLDIEPSVDIRLNGQDKLNTSKRFYQYIFGAGHQHPYYYDIFQPKEPFASITKSGAISALGDRIRFVQLNVEGKPIEEWTLYNPLIEDCDFGGERESGDEEIEKISCTLIYDYATFKTI